MALSWRDFVGSSGTGDGGTRTESSSHLINLLGIFIAKAMLRPGSRILAKLSCNYRIVENS